jgi:hypothetical protein
MAVNATWRAINQFAAFSGQGKKQAAFDNFMDLADLDTRDACLIEQNDEVTRREEFDCDGVKLVNEPIDRRFVQFRLTYEKINGQIAARFKAYEQGVAAASTGAAANEVVTITRNGTVSGGDFTISLTFEGKTGTTDAIAYDASNATILAALLKKTGSTTAMGKLLKAGDVAVSGTWGTAITLTYGGRYANTNMTELTTVDTNLTGGGSLDVATTTPGDSELHAISQSTDGSLPLFCMATGDKLGSTATRVYGNCAVESVNFNFPESGNVQMVVVINATYVPESSVSFSVPACVNIRAMKVSDCKFKIDSVFQGENVYTAAMTSNNNIPVEAAFSLDDIDTTEAWQRGDRPTQSKTYTICGNENHVLNVLAEAEETLDNEVEDVAYLGIPGDRLTITAPDAKIYFQQSRIGFVGPLRKRAMNLVASPHEKGSGLLTYSYQGTQTASFLVAST